MWQVVRCPTRHVAYKLCESPNMATTIKYRFQLLFHGTRTKWRKRVEYGLIYIAGKPIKKYYVCFLRIERKISSTSTDRQMILEKFGKTRKCVQWKGSVYIIKIIKKPFFDIFLLQSMKILFQKRDFLYKVANNKIKVICQYEFINGCFYSSSSFNPGLSP